MSDEGDSDSRPRRAGAFDFALSTEEEEDDGCRVEERSDWRHIPFRYNNDEYKYTRNIVEEPREDISSTASSGSHRKKKRPHVAEHRTRRTPPRDTPDDGDRESRGSRRNPLVSWRFLCSPSTLRSCVVLAGFVCATFYIHMFLQQEYFRRCKSNVIRVVLFKQSHMCTHMHNVLTFIENTYFYGMKRLADTVLLPLYNAGLALNGFGVMNMSDP